MATIIDLTEQELADIKSLTKQADDVAAVRSAMNESLRFARRMHLKGLSGQVEMEDNWQALEASEMRRPHGDPATGAR